MTYVTMSDNGGLQIRDSSFVKNKYVYFHVIRFSTYFQVLKLATKKRSNNRQQFLGSLKHCSAILWEVYIHVRILKIILQRRSYDIFFF